jgi:hypothetical protein
MRPYPLDSTLTLVDACPKWLQEHSRYLKPHTIRGYTAALKSLTTSMGSLCLKEIDVSHIRTYQTERGSPAGT